MLELLVRSGRDIRHTLMMMAPEAWERLPEGEVTPERRAFYEYHSALMEPWDSTTTLTYTNGRIVGTAMDRNGLRPAGARRARQRAGDLRQRDRRRRL